MPWFDANCLLGPQAAAPAEAWLDLDATIEALAAVGIDRALVTSAVARDYDPLAGNERLAGELAGRAGLVPCFVVLPPDTGEFPRGDALLAYLAAAGARAVRIYPRLHNFGIGARWTAGLFGPLAEAGIPVLIDATQADWPEVDDVLSRHPALTLIICRPGYRLIRWAWPLLAAHCGLVLETSLWQACGGIEAVVERFGPERLVFGTGLPEAAPGGAVSMITYAQIAPEARAAIAGGTLERLLWDGGRP